MDRLGHKEVTLTLSLLSVSLYSLKPPFRHGPHLLQVFLGLLFFRQLTIDISGIWAQVGPSKCGDLRLEPLRAKVLPETTLPSRIQIQSLMRLFWAGVRP